jgi:hypothetical protein
MKKMAKCKSGKISLIPEFWEIARYLVNEAIEIVGGNVLNY